MDAASPVAALRRGRLVMPRAIGRIGCEDGDWTAVMNENWHVGDGGEKSGQEGGRRRAECIESTQEVPGSKAWTCPMDTSLQCGKAVWRLRRMKAKTMAKPLKEQQARPASVHLLATSPLKRLAVARS